MKIYDSRDVNITAVDTVSAVVQRGEDGDSGRFDVPGDATMLKDIIVVAIGNGATAGKANALFRLSGGGLLNGPEVMPGQGSGASVATGNERSMPAHRFKDLDIQVIPTNGIDVVAEMTGEDVGEMMAAITLVFEVA